MEIKNTHKTKHDKNVYLPDSKCDMCEMVFLDQWKLKRHQQNVHKVSSPVKAFKFTKCYYRTKKCKKPQKQRNWQVGPDRTFANLIEDNENWVSQTESDRDKLKKIQCVKPTYLFEQNK